MKSWQSLASTLESDYRFNQHLNLFSYLTYERINSLQQGFNHNTRADTLPPRNQDNIWKVDNLDQIYTTGAGIIWQVIEDKLNIQVDYTHSSAITRIRPTISTLTSANNLPELTTRLHALTIKGDYQLLKSLLIRLSYRLEKFNTRDFAQDGITNNTVPQLLSLGNQSPDYFAHVMGMSFVYRF